MSNRIDCPTRGSDREEAFVREHLLRGEKLGFVVSEEEPVHAQTHGAHHVNG